MKTITLLLKAFRYLSLVLALAFSFAFSVNAKSGHGLDYYTIRGDADQVSILTMLGYDLTEAKVHIIHDTFKARLVLTPAQREELISLGLKVTPTLDSNGRSARQRAQEMEEEGLTVFKPFDGPGGLREYYYSVANEPRNKKLVELRVIGYTVQGREIIALRVTDPANNKNKPKKSKHKTAQRPAVLYLSLIHAREWIAGEITRRALRDFVEGYHNKDPEIMQILSTTDIWFIPVQNPDGYQYTHDVERLWRKNLRDNNNDGQITAGDGVDLNRNHSPDWGYDNEGSSPDPFSETYRGPSAGSEPETQAVEAFIDEIKPVFASNVHSVAELILFGGAGVTDSIAADNPILVALAGVDANSAVPGFDPGNGAVELYSTNGGTGSSVQANGGLSFTPEMSDADTGGGFVFPDDETLVEQEYQRIKPFHMSLAKSAVDPANPVSSVGIVTKPFYLSSIESDLENGAITTMDFSFDTAYQGDQQVRVVAKRALGDVTVNYQINGGGTQTAPTTEWQGGDIYAAGPSNYYAVMVGQVTGADVGDTVTVWFTGGGETSDSFTYTVANNSTNKLLIVANEDYTGVQFGTTGPADTLNYLSYYTDALDALGVDYDVYDVDAMGHEPPHPLGILSSYDAVIWYTGENLITGEPDWDGGNIFGDSASGASRDVTRMNNGMRDFINEGGRVFVSGVAAMVESTTGLLGPALYDPFDNAPCYVGGAESSIIDFCRYLQQVGDFQNDILQYVFGSYINNIGAGVNPDTGIPLDVVGQPGSALAGISYSLNGMNAGSDIDGSPSTDYRGLAQSFITTADFLQLTDPSGSFPQFASVAAGTYVSGGGAGGLSPHTGNWMVWSQSADYAYKRLTRTISVPVGGATLEFWANYNTEIDWDYFMVEAHTVGVDDWTLLPDMNGHTSSNLSFDQSCAGGWSNLNDPINLIHPQLAKYQTFVDGSTPCLNTGTTGEWHATSGSSGGWVPFSIDLSAYAGTDVEVSLVYVSDWGFQQFHGVFLDDIQVVPNDPSVEGFETGFGDWVVSGAPAGTDDNLNDWTRQEALPVTEAAVIQTDRTLYMGHAFENISTPAKREEVMEKILEFLLPD